MIPGLSYYHPQGLPAQGEIRVLRLPRAGESLQVTITTPQEQFVFTYGIDFFGDGVTSTAASLANAINADRASFGKSHFNPTPTKPFFAIYYGDKISLIATTPGPVGNTYQISAPSWIEAVQFSKGRLPFRFSPQGKDEHTRFKVLSLNPTAYLGCVGASSEESDYHLLIFDRQIEPTPTSEPLASFTLYARSPILYQLSLPIPCASGLTVAISNSPTTYNNALPDDFSIYLGHYLA